MADHTHHVDQPPPMLFDDYSALGGAGIGPLGWEGGAGLLDHTAAHDGGSAAIRFTELPEHLRYHPMVVPNQYQSVMPRYLEPRKPLPPSSAFDAVPKPIPKSSAFASATPRYLDALHTIEEKRLQRSASAGGHPSGRWGGPSDAAGGKGGGAAPIDYRELPEFRLHRSLSQQLGFGSNIASRHLEKTNEITANATGHGTKGYESPRHSVDRHRKENARALGFRVGALPSHSLSFDDHRRRNQKLISMMSRKSKTAPSVIGAYVREGIPIPHHTTSASYVTNKGGRNRSHSPGNNNTAASSSGGVRGRSPERDSGRWTPSGGCGGGRWNTRPSSPKSAANHRLDVKVKEIRQKRKEASVPRSNVPRVAYLSPSHSLLRWEQSMRESAERGDVVVVGEDGSTTTIPPPTAPPPAHPPGSVHYHHAPSAVRTPPPSPSRRSGHADHLSPTTPPRSGSAAGWQSHRNSPFVSPQRRGEHTILVGPVTVAVPPGAIVRVTAE